MFRLRTFSAYAILLSASSLGADGVAASRASGAGKTEVCQVAVLQNGFSIEFARSEVSGKVTTLWLCGDGGSGYVEVPSEQIQGFEPGAGAIAPMPAGADSAPAVIPNVQRPDATTFNGLIAGAAARHAIDADFVASVVRAESRFNPQAVSPKGARGLMQLMPATAAVLGVENALDPAENVEGGTALLRKLLDQYAGNAQKALAAYNAGPERVKQYGGVPPYRETREYIVRVIDDFNRKKLQQRPPSMSSPTKE